MPSNARKMGLVEPLRISEGISRGELAKILRDASRNAHQLIGQNLLQYGAGTAAEAERLRAVMAGLDSLSQSLWGSVGQETRQGVRDAADLVVTQSVRRTQLLGMPERALTQYGAGLRFNAFQAAEDIISRRTNGFTLADRIYRNGRATTLQVGKIVERGLAQQLGHRSIAKQVRQHFAPNVPGGTSYAAKRLARTEINNAHHDTTRRLTKDQPWVYGYRWNISASHPRPDECDDLANDDIHNLGPGVYRDDPGPKPHPQCLCYIEVMQVSRSEFIDQLTSGRYDSYLSEMGVFR